MTIVKNSKTVQSLVKHQKLFLDFLDKRLGSRSVAEDLFQNSLRKVIESDAVQPDEMLIPWFYRVLRNSLIDHYRNRAAEGRKKDAFLSQLEIDQAKSHPPADEIGQTICQCLKELLPSLPQNYSQVISRVDLGGQSIQEVAQDLKISENSLSVRLHRARASMKKALLQACGVCTRHGCLDCHCQELSS